MLCYCFILYICCHTVSVSCAVLVWFVSGVVLNYKLRLKYLTEIFSERLRSTWSHLRSGSHKTLLSSRRARHVTDEATGRALLAGKSLGWGCGMWNCVWFMPRVFTAMKGNPLFRTKHATQEWYETHIWLYNCFRNHSTLLCHMEQLQLLSHWWWLQTRSPLKLTLAPFHFPDGNMQMQHHQCKHRGYNMKQKLQPISKILMMEDILSFACELFHSFSNLLGCNNSSPSGINWWLYPEGKWRPC
jgi:hypothetical protein